MGDYDDEVIELAAYARARAGERVDASSRTATVGYAALSADIFRAADYHRHDLAATFDYLRAVIDVRFLILYSALRMTEEIISDDE